MSPLFNPSAGRSQGNVPAAAPVDDCVQSEFPSGLAKKVFEIAAVIRIFPAWRRPRNSCRCRPGVRRCVRRFSAADSSGWCAVISRNSKDRSSRTSGKRQARRRRFPWPWGRPRRLHTRLSQMPLKNCLRSNSAWSGSPAMMTSWLLPSFRPRRTNPRFSSRATISPRGCFCQDIVQRQKSRHFATGERYRLAVGVLAKRRSISRSNTDRMFALLRHYIDPHRCPLNL